MALAAGGAGIYWRAHRPQEFESLAVLPLTNATGDPENDYISEGISESIINRLSQTRLKVTAQATAFRLKQTAKDVDPLAAAQQLKVAAVLTGRITKQGIIWWSRRRW